MNFSLKSICRSLQRFYQLNPWEPTHRCIPTQRASLLENVTPPLQLKLRLAVVSQVISTPLWSKQWEKKEMKSEWRTKGKISGYGSRRLQTGKWQAKNKERRDLKGRRNRKSTQEKTTGLGLRANDGEKREKGEEKYLWKRGDAIGVLGQAGHTHLDRMFQKC